MENFKLHLHNTGNELKLPKLFVIEFEIMMVIDV